MSIVANVLQERLESSGGEVYVQEFNYDDADYRTQLLNIKQQNPDGLVILGHDEQGLIMKQARDLGINSQFYTTGTITSPPAQEAASGYAEGTLFAYWESSESNHLAQEFEAKFIEKVGRGAILPLTTHPAYDTAKVLFEEVFADINGAITEGKIRNELLDVQNYQGTTGMISFEKDGGARIPESIFRLVGGLPVLVK